MSGIGRIGRQSGAEQAAGPAAARSGSGGGSGFAVRPEGGGTAEGVRATRAAAVPACALGAMLAAQEQAFETIRDRQARRRGQDMLRALRSVQAAMVADRDDPDALGMLASLAGDAVETDTPALAAALGSIVLRARVELARRGL